MLPGSVGEPATKRKKVNNLKLRVLERAHANPELTRGGLVDAMGDRDKAEENIDYLVTKGYLRDRRGIELTDKGFACIDSGSFRNRAKQAGKGALGNWLWVLIQTVL